MSDHEQDTEFRLEQKEYQPNTKLHDRVGIIEKYLTPNSSERYQEILKIRDRY